MMEVIKWDGKGVFENHVATKYIFSPEEGTNISPIYRIEWCNPKSSFYAMTFLFMDYTLIVRGDVGDAIYAWGAPPSGPEFIDWVAGLDLHYFHSKCVSSEHGAVPYEWDGEKAFDRMREYINENHSNDFDFETDLRDLEDACFSRDSFIHWAHNQFMNNDWADYEIDLDVGNRIPLRTGLHLGGLKMAVEQLKVKE